MPDAPRTSEPSSSKRLVIALCVALTACVGATIALVAASREAARDAAEATSEASALEMHELRLSLTRTALDELVVRTGVMANVLSPSDLERAANNRTSAWAAAHTKLASLANDESLAAEAEFVTDLLDRSEPITMDDLFAISGGAQFERRSLALTDIEIQLDHVDQALTFPLYEAFVVEVERSGSRSDAIDTTDAEFLEIEADITRDNPGYLGPDSSAPWTDSWFAFEGGSPEELERLDDVNILLAAGNSWTVEQWTRAWAAGSSDPSPVPLADFSIETTQNTTILRAITSGALASEINDATSRQSSANAAARRARLGSLATLIGSAACIIALGATMLDRIRRTRELADTDVLTGAGNRRRLDIAAMHLADASLPHHVVAVIDLDRFKLVNDTHGHATGDRVLRELALQLRAVAESMNTRSHELIRLGGDEFMITLHHDAAIDTAALDAKLEDVQTVAITAPTGDTIPLSFSFGHVATDQAASLPELMDAADLRAYRDKGRRRENRKATQQIVFESDARVDLTTS